MATYLPHYLTAAPSRLHRDLVADLTAIRTHRGARRNYRAPRSNAKTTVGTVGYALNGAVEGSEPFTLLLSESGDIAAEFLRSIKEELEGNPRLAADYPEACGVGPVWKGEHVVLRNGACVMTRGAGGRIRGLKHRQHRPTLVILDDPNEKGDAYSPTGRRRKLDWLNKDVLSVGGPGTNFVCYGTPIHREAIVCVNSANGTWQTRQYRAVEHWPDRMDLWMEWERLLANLADATRADTALRFYAANKAEMDRGAEVLWPERESLYDLMLHRATVGPAAFASEKQDEPGTDGATEWPAEWFDRPDIWFDDWPDEVVLSVQSLDPSKGMSAKSGDFQAHVRAGLVPDGTILVEADLRREPDYVGRCLDLAKAWQPSVLVAEGNNTMGLIAPELNRQIAERVNTPNAVLVDYEEVTHTEPKLSRVRALGGYLSRGQIRVRNTPGGRLLVEQLRDVPNGEYDDGPDALATAVRRLEQLINGG